MTIRQAALEYLARGWSVIPVGPNKRPLVPWKEYQSSLPPQSEVEKWFRHYPEANVGIVTGHLSGLSVIDIDNDHGKRRVAEFLSDNFRCPVVITPKGGRHLYCQYSPGMTNNCRAIEGVDLRAEGGYVVAPPSRALGGGGWVWDENNGPKTPIPPLPPKYVEAVVENVIAPGERTFHVQPGRTFEVGSRNNALYHLAMRLAVGRMPDDEIMEYCQWAGKQAGMAESEIKATTVSAIGRGKRQERNLTKDVRELVAATTGDFIVTDIYRELEVINREDKNTIRVALARLKKDGIIEKSGRKDGGYRRVSTELVPIEWKTAPTEEAGIILPLGLNRLVNIYPKNIMVASGLQNAGKTAFCMETARLNMGHHKVVYFSSEMGASELSLRLSKRQDIKTDDWNVEFYERSSQFVDVIRPDWVNIVDYLEVNDEFWRVGQILTEIHDRLTSGVALVSIQKNEKTDYGRGGTFSAEKPRLYIAINPGEVKIVKAKNWKGTENPNGKVKKFTIQGGWKFVETSDWYYPEQEERTGGRR